MPKENTCVLITFIFSDIEGHLDLEQCIFNLSHFFGELLNFDTRNALKFEGEAYLDVKKNKRTFKKISIRMDYLVANSCTL